MPHPTESKQYYFYLLLIAAFFLPATGLPDSAINNSEAEISATAESDYRNTLQNEIDQAHAKQWGISITEWQRYKYLMQGIRGSVSPASISPIEVLGIHATSDAEKKRYAEIWSRMMHEDIERVLAFQRAYDEATTLLYGNVPLINDEKLEALRKQYEPIKPNLLMTSTDKDRLVYITDIQCTTCKRLITTLITKSKSIKMGLDIYLTGTKGIDRIAQEWAQNENLPKDRVYSREITINHENGLLQKIEEKAPYLGIRTSLGFRRINIDDL